MFLSVILTKPPAWEDWRTGAGPCCATQAMCVGTSWAASPLNALSTVGRCIVESLVGLPCFWRLAGRKFFRWV